MYKFSIKIPIYKCTCHVIISKDISDVINKYVKKKKWNADYAIKTGEDVHGYAVTDGTTTDYYIFYSLESLTANYIAHEISHLIDFIFEEKDIERHGEARAYLTGYISEKIFDYVLKKQIFINKWYKPLVKEQDILIIQKEEDEKPS
jgi:hypothetical protein